MRITETFKTREAEGLYSSLLVIVVLLILPMLGAMAMLVGSVVGLAVYLTLFRAQIRNGSRTRALAVSGLIALLLAAGIGALMVLNGGR